MPYYYKLGKIPAKRHTTFEKDKGGFFYEQLFGTEGFHGLASLLYHTHRPTQIKEIQKSYSVIPEVGIEKNMLPLKLIGFNVKPEDDFLESRKPLFLNSDLLIGVAAPKKSMKDYFYKNADGDEVLFIHQGKGKVRTMLGTLPFQYGDYIVIPKGIIYQIEFDTEENRIFYVESLSPVYSPRRYRNEFGQLGEHSPYCERDIHPPVDLETHDEKGDFVIKIKKQGMIFPYVYATHPFDVVGWDGHNYPYTFSIHDFEPITGRVHQPPPVHQTFEGHNFVICSFCPRLYDYHPKAIPAPYNHSNIDSDELLYYVDGDFMSRNDIGKGHMTLHPSGIPHGPHPGAMERSIGKTKTDELAVMVDTFRPLMITKEALNIQDGNYYKSWLE
jgi:homogentisate 1,2-dioxygenase